MFNNFPSCKQDACIRKKWRWMERREIVNEKFLVALVAKACMGRTALDTNVLSVQEPKKVKQVTPQSSCVSNFEWTLQEQSREQCSERERALSRRSFKACHKCLGVPTELQSIIQIFYAYRQSISESSINYAYNRNILILHYQLTTWKK